MLTATANSVRGRIGGRGELPENAADRLKQPEPREPEPHEHPEPWTEDGLQDKSATPGDREDARLTESAYDLLQRGTALLENHHNAQAAVVLERAARLEPNKSSILEALGRAYFNSSQPARAAETFQSLLDVDPSAHYGHFALGLSFARLGRPLEARTHLRLATAMNPTSETYRRALERVEVAKG
jgi:tetratricopeptide (TPR) repeat protein